MGVTKKRDDNPLKRQKPFRRKKKRRLRQLRPALLICLAAVISAFGLYALPWQALRDELDQRMTASIYPRPASPWQIVVSDESGQMVAPADRDKLIAGLTSILHG